MATAKAALNAPLVPNRVDGRPLRKQVVQEFIQHVEHEDVAWKLFTTSPQRRGCALHAVVLLCREFGCSSLEAREEHLSRLPARLVVRRFREVGTLSD